jgi:hypothetical protein
MPNGVIKHPRHSANLALDCSVARHCVAVVVGLTVVYTSHVCECSVWRTITGGALVGSGGEGAHSVMAVGTVQGEGVKDADRHCPATQMMLCDVTNR